VGSPRTHFEYKWTLESSVQNTHFEYIKHSAQVRASTYGECKNAKHSSVFSTPPECICYSEGVYLLLSVSAFVTQNTLNLRLGIIEYTQKITNQLK
jgi:hypothetical protein